MRFGVVVEVSMTTIFFDEIGRAFALLLLFRRHHIHWFERKRVKVPMLSNHLYRSNNSIRHVRVNDGIFRTLEILKRVA